MYASQLVVNLLGRVFVSHPIFCSVRRVVALAVRSDHKAIVAVYGRFAPLTFRPRLWSFRPRQWTVRVRPRL